MAPLGTGTARDIAKRSANCGRDYWVTGWDNGSGEALLPAAPALMPTCSGWEKQAPRRVSGPLAVEFAMSSVHVEQRHYGHGWTRIHMDKKDLVLSVQIRVHPWPNRLYEARPRLNPRSSLNRG